MVTLIIKDTLPGINEYTNACRKNAFAGNQMKRFNQGLVEMYIKDQLKGVTFKKKVYLTYHFFERDRRRDLDNISGFAHKIIQDALVEQKVIYGDGWRFIKGFEDHFAVDKENPRIAVDIEEV